MMGHEVCRRYSIVRDISFLLRGQAVQYEMLCNRWMHAIAVLFKL